MGASLLKSKMIAHEGDVKAGALSVNDAYDLTLYELPTGHYELVLFMKVQFFFESGSGGDWTDAEKTKYMKDWEIAVKNAWSGRRIHRTKGGKEVSLRTDFVVQQGGWMLDHWEISVTRIKSGDFRTSYVNPSWGNVVLDSEDLRLTPKGHGSMQRGVVHEFGHMIGLVDEYPKGHAHAADYSSVMNRGESIRARHGDSMLDWVKRKLKEYGIK
jgi:hypothetical protein